MQIENFVVHPERRNGQRTDADLLAVRFPFRAERLFDNPSDIMTDDEQVLALSSELIDIVIAEVKTNQPCSLNKPWKQSDRQNVHRVLSAIGCLPPDQICVAATNIYDRGCHCSNTLRIRLIAVGSAHSDELSRTHPEVRQLIWRDMLSFIWQRFYRYRNQKTDVQQWDAMGRKIKELVCSHHRSRDDFVAEALNLLGVRDVEGIHVDQDGTSREKVPNNFR